MQFTVTGPDKSIEDTRRRLTYFEEHQREHGFSKWIMLDADSGVANGDSGLLVLEECGWIDLGFRLAQEHWGRGLATEAASAWVNVAFDGLQPLHAPSNATLSHLSAPEPFPGWRQKCDKLGSSR